MNNYKVRFIIKTKSYRKPYRTICRKIEAINDNQAKNKVFYELYKEGFDVKIPGEATFIK